MKTPFKYRITNRVFRRNILLSISLTLFIPSLFAQVGDISGIVFHDYNFNGNQDEFEYGAEGILIRAYGSDETIHEVNTNQEGSYELSNLSFANTSYRLEFHMSENYEAYRHTVSGSKNNSNIRFIRESSDSVNLGISLPEDYCEADPVIGMSCFIDGNYLDATIYDYGYAIMDYGQEGKADDIGYIPPGHIASAREIGATYGSAYCPTQNAVYTSAVTKRHAGYGELGPGGIYLIDLNHQAYPGKVQPLFSIDGISKPDGSKVDVGGDFDRDLSIPGTPTKDSMAYAAAVKSSIGDIEVSWDGSKLYIVNLFESELLVYDLINKAIIKVFEFDTYSCNNGRLRPFGLKLKGNSIFVGAVCTAEMMEGTEADLTAVVFEIKNSEDPQKVLEFPLNYNRNGKPDFNWHVWRDEYMVLRPFGFREQVYPQPLVGDIEFIEDGSMVLGIVDRYGFQTGYTNMNMKGEVEERGIPMGDLIKVCRVNGEWIVEGSEGSCSVSKDASAVDNGGPNGTEFYDDESVIHDELSQGSLAILMGSGELINTVVDPLRFDSFGPSFMDNKTGKCVRKYEVGYEISTFVKGQSLGDVEVFCGLAPLEIGNYVWMDENADGIQDAGEQPIADCEVCLHDTRGNVLGCVNTDENGHYSIGNEDIGDSTLRYGAQYFVSVGHSGQFNPSTGLFRDEMELTSSNVGTGLNRNWNDSDGYIAPESIGRGVLEGLPVAEVYLNRPGDIEHGCDFGFRRMSAKIGNYVWIDVNDNQIMDSTETGLGNFKITLLDEDLLPIRTTYTKDNGSYEFEIDLAGEYHLQLDTIGNNMFAIMEHDTLEQDYGFSSSQRGQTVPIYIEVGEQDLLWDFAVKRITIDTIVIAVEGDSTVLCIPDSVIDLNGIGSSQLVNCESGSVISARNSSISGKECLTYTPENPNDFTSETLCYITCLDGVCDTTVLILIGSRAPVSVDDTTTLENLDDVVIIEVMLNDFDPDGDSVILRDVLVEPMTGDIFTNSDGSIEYIPSNSFSEIDSFTYQICDLYPDGDSIKDGCSESKVYIYYEKEDVVVEPDFSCFIPTGISPNGDGKNDYFEIECINFLAVKPQLRVYNRWGQMVYSDDSYDNDWNGFFNGKMLAGGTYFYSLTAMDDSNELTSKAGSVEIRR